MSFYHVYAGRERMMLRAVTDDIGKAKAACTAIRAVRPLPEDIITRRGVAGVVTGTPVWVRYFGDGPALMITQHASQQAALDAEEETFCDVITAVDRLVETLAPVP